MTRVAYDATVIGVSDYNEADNQPNDATAARGTASGVPLRGMAMILLAVAVLLLAWGVWSMTRDDSGTETRGTLAPTANPTAPGIPGSQAPGAAANPAPADTAAGNAGNAAQGEAGNANADAPATPATGNAAQGAPARGDNSAPAASVPTNAPVVVLNNSTLQGLAADVADRIRPNFAVAEVGNYADGTFPHSVALYTPGNAVEEATAKTLARSLNITAEPRGEEMRDQPAGVLLILTQDMPR